VSEQPPNEERGHGQHEAERLSPMPPLPQTATEPEQPRGAVRKLAIDLGPLRRHRDFRLLWIGQTVSMIGDGIYIFAVAWFV